MTGTTDGPPPGLDPEFDRDDDLILERLRAASDADVEDDEDLPALEEFDEDGEEIWTGKELVALFALTILAASLRLFRLNEWSLWVDEAHTLRDATMPLEHFWNSLVSNYPIAFLTLRGSLDHLPELSEGWLRLPFAFAGILTVPLLAIVGRGIVGGRAAMLGALFLAVDPWHIYWTQNVRGYVLMLPFALVSVGVFWSAIQRGSKLLYLASLVFLVAAGMTHPTAYLLAGVFVVVMFLNLWHRPGIYRTGLIVWSVVLCGAVAVALYPLAQQHILWVQDAKSSPSTVHLVQTSAYFFRVPLSLAAVAGFLAMRRGEHSPGGWYLGLWAFVPLAVLFVLSLGLFQVTAQYAFYCLPAFCLLAGFLCVEWMQRATAVGAKSKALRYALPVVLVCEMGAYDALYFTTQHGDRPRWREASQVVTDAAAPATVLTTNAPSLDYYLRRERYFGGDLESATVDVRSIEWWTIEEQGGGADFMRDEQRDAIQSGRRLFVILTEPEFHEKDSSGECADWLRRHSRLLRRLPVWAGPKDMTAFVYEVDTTR